MKIGNWDISKANAKQRRLTIGHHSIKSNSKWNEGADRPVFANATIGWKDINVEIMVKGLNYEDIVINTGAILQRLEGRNTLTFERTSHFFDCVLSKYSVTETVKDKWHILKLSLTGIEYGDEQKFTNKTASGEYAGNSIEVNNVGTLLTPVTLKIYPHDYSVVGEETDFLTDIMNFDGEIIVDSDAEPIADYVKNYADLRVDGMCFDPITGEDIPIIIKNMKSESEIIIDGETGIITEDGVPKIDDADIWALPSLKAGKTTIKLNGEFIDMVATYKPRYF